MIARRLALLIASCLLLGCGKGPAATGPTEPLRVAAASDLQGVMPRLIREFKERTGVEVAATFGASGQLAQQVKQGAPFDVFLSANGGFIDGCVSAGAIDAETVRVYALGSLALVVRTDVPETIGSLADLKDPAIKKVAIANPETAPYGLAARQALTRSGLWDELEPKRVQAETVRQALQFVQAGNAEAAIVGSAIARVDGVRVVPIDGALHDPIRQTLGITTATRRRDDATAFARFLLTEAGPGRAILRDAGFVVDFGK